jgi:hypothetical protein
MEPEPNIWSFQKNMDQIVAKMKHDLSFEHEIKDNSFPKLYPVINNTVEMIQYIRLWQLRQLLKNPPEEYTLELTYKYLLKIVSAEDREYFLSRDYNELPKMIEKITEEQILQKLKGDFPIEYLKFSENPEEWRHEIITVQFYDNESDIVETKMFNDALLPSSMFREYLYSKNRTECFGIHLQIDKKTDIISALTQLLHRNIDYYEVLNSIEEIYYFIQMFEYLKLKFVD